MTVRACASGRGRFEDELSLEFAMDADELGPRAGMSAAWDSARCTVSLGDVVGSLVASFGDAGRSFLLPFVGEVFANASPGGEYWVAASLVALTGSFNVLVLGVAISILGNEGWPARLCVDGMDEDGLGRGLGRGRANEPWAAWWGDVEWSVGEGDELIISRRPDCSGISSYNARRGVGWAG
jgi:hypothetical protein